MESESEEILYATGMPNENAGESDVFQGNITRKSCLIPTPKCMVAVNQQPKR